MKAEIVEHHEFAGWTMKKADFDSGVGVAIERTDEDGKKIRHAARAPNVGMALAELRAWVAENA